MCQIEGCNKKPVYGKIEDKKALYCRSHRVKDLIDVVCRRCIKYGCNKVPSFGLPGKKKKAIFCSDHKEEGMDNVRSTRCGFQGCKTVTNGSRYGRVCSKCCNKLIMISSGLGSFV